MAFQGITHPREQVNQIAEIEGSKLIGTRVKPPFGVHPEVYVLPMDNVLATKVPAGLECQLHMTDVAFVRAIGYRRRHLRPL